MTDFNASQAAKRIGISDRTIRRWLKPDKHGKIKLASTRTESGQLAIASSDVERLRQEVEEERTRFVTTTHAYATARPEMPTHDIGQSVGHDIDTRMASLAQSIANLNSTIDIQSRRINELTSRVAELEARQIYQPTQPQPTLHRYIVDREEAKPQSRTSVSSSPIPSDLPEGTLHSTEFATQIGLTKTVFEGMMKNGIRGEQLERVKIPASRDGRNTNYFTPEQQAKAIELLRKHGKLP